MTPMLSDLPATVPQALERAGRAFPDRGMAIFDGRGRKYQRRTWTEVHAGARRAAGQWAALGVSPGDPVMISVPTSWAWVDAWLGALMRGALPVAVAPGSAMGAAEAHVRKVDTLVERLGAKFVVSSEALRRDAQALGADHAAGAVLTPAELEGTTPSTFGAPNPAVEEIAFLQLTSGSTGLPLAVQIPHGAAIHNAAATDAAIGAPHGGPSARWADSLVAWLPVHHDMGLIGCFFLSMLAGIDFWLFPPTAFLARPRTWLDHLGSHGKSFVPAPNFGYQLCVERVGEKEREGLDLSSWCSAMTGAEMVRPETIDAFCQAFEPVGFRREVFRPCYGLAEATLTVAVDLRGEGPRTRPLPSSASGSDFGLSEVVSVGVPIHDTQIHVVAPNGQPLPEGEIGEVQVQGPGIFAGYYNSPEASAAALTNGRLATGDLGFMWQGELYLTGRIKDVLILHGHNIMPHELEWQAESVTDAGGSMRTGAFSVARGAQGEEAVVVVETNDRDVDKLNEMGREIRSRIGKNLSLPLADLVFVRRGQIPKTTSGKVQRRALKAQYLEGTLQRLDRSEG